MTHLPGNHDRPTLSSILQEIQTENHSIIDINCFKKKYSLEDSKFHQYLKWILPIVL